jgi:hypothetical protein
VYPEVCVYSDPFDGLTVELTELRGLIKLVPPLIEADRERRWKEIGARPGDPDAPEVIDIYEAEAGAEEGWGFADFGRTIHVAAVVTAWAVFQDYLARELREKFLSYDLSKQPPLAALVEEEQRAWDRRFERIEKRYRDFAGIPLAQWQSWDQVRHARELRNALVHNQVALGPHLIDLALWLSASEATSVRASRLTPERVQLEIRMTNGVARVDLAADLPSVDLIEARDAAGTLFGRRSGTLVRRALRRIRRPRGGALVDSLALQLDAFAATARGEPGGPLARAADGVAVMAVIEAARRSADAGGADSETARPR